MAYHPLGWLTVKSNIARYFRPPDLTELFGDRGVVVGNSALKPEEGINFDVGVRTVLDRWFENGSYLEMTWFQTNSDNLIVFTQNSQRTSIARNVGKARIRGLEISSAVKAGGGLKLSFNYTFQDAVDQSDIPHLNGKTLPDRPKHDLFVRVENRFGRFRPFYEFDYTGLVYLDRANFMKTVGS